MKPKNITLKCNKSSGSKFYVGEQGPETFETLFRLDFQSFSIPLERDKMRKVFQNIKTQTVLVIPSQHLLVES